MEYVKLGNSGLDVSKICLGCMGFGDTSSGFNTWAVDKDESKKVILGAYALGINFFDTANCYSYGTSEEYVGNAIKALPREEIVIATKVFIPMRLEKGADPAVTFPPKATPNGGGLSRKEIVYEAEQSLKRLGLDYIDLYIIHRWDYNTPIEETMQALNDLVRSGKVRYIGASAMYAWQFQKAQYVAEKNGWTKFISMQNHYNLLYREEEREMIPLCVDQKVALTPYSPLASGRLSRDWSVASKRSKTDMAYKGKYLPYADVDLPIAERVAELAKKHGEPMSRIALSWLLSKPYVASPIIGGTKLEYVKDAVEALNVQLTADEYAYLEELYVPHGIVGAL
ncbi:MAG: aldo/keto reductase [Bifidobacteriaceae bacterium]|jgi:aryl-alcohol dehydrogenase-like predicted oxidoreductase|nr:aldo/keto reductase [Bifidobacteriaceae bacterium]